MLWVLSKLVWKYLGMPDHVGKVNEELHQKRELTFLFVVGLQLLLWCPLVHAKKS